jgi:bifunctional DNA-binding transcriptional regulator/antitoxin component of YhaV-PrlF toxin-antitoxin module
VDISYYPKFLDVAPPDTCSGRARQGAFVSNAVLPYNAFMSTLTVTARGQVTFRKSVMRHLGVKPGEKIELELLPDGRGMIKAARRSGKIEDFFGVLAGKTKKVATIEEINQAAADGWAGLVKMGEK